MRNACTVLILLLFALPVLPAQQEDQKPPGKVVVLGIDALDKRLMDQFIEEGHLPNFEKLANEGHYGRLETSYPPMSPAAWSTMTTGLNPGKTGIYGFLKRRDGSYEPELSLVRPNNTEFAGGGPGARAGMTLVFALGVFGLALMLGTVANALIRRGKKGPPWLFALFVLAMLGASPLPALGDKQLTLLSVGVMLAGAAGFGFGVARNRLRPRTWLFPVLALWLGGFSLVNTLPESLPKPATNRGGETFWSMADRHGVRTRVIGAPVAWPADEGLRRGKMTTGLATPDAMGTYHTYTLFTEPHHELAGGLTEMSGRVERLEFEDGVAGGLLLGPPAKFDRDVWKGWEDGDLPRMPREEIPFEVRRAEGGGVTLTFPEEFAEGEQEFGLKVGQWVRHIRVKYRLGAFATLHGTVSFKLLAGGRRVRLYATPVQFDPLVPNKRFAVSDPLEFAPRVARRWGMYQTIGWAEATSALNDGVIDDETFLETCHHSFDEKRAQILGLLKDARSWDLLAAFTYEVDRVSHMMWRHMDDRHPNHDPNAPAHWKSAIRDFYVKYDTLVGEVLELLPENAVLIACSDHGFAPFYRAVNLNRWLRDEGYLVLKEDTGAPTMEYLFDEQSGYYNPYDWSKTRAYALGLSKIYINLEGREPQGIVRPGAEAEALKDEIIEKLMALRDNREHGYARVMSGVWRAEDIWEGPRVRESGDLQIGYAWGYRVSWQTSLGGADEPLIFDNLKNWSGDHCSFDPKVVPGVVFSNRKLDASRYRLVDVGLTALEHLRVPLPMGRGDKDGRPWSVK